MLKEVQSLLSRLAEADGAWQREKARALAWRLVPAFLAAAVVAVALDAFLQLPAAARLALLGIAAVALLVAAGIVAWIGWRARNPPERVARHLEQRDPQLGSSLINALQLAGQAEDAALANLTRRLAAGAVQQYADGLSGVGLRKLAVTGDARKRGRVAAWTAAGFVALLALFFPVTSMVVPRFVDPLGDHPPYAFTRLELVDPGEAGTNIMYGGSLTVRARWSGHEPRELFLTFAPATKPGASTTLPMIRAADHLFSQELPDIREDLVVTAHSRGRGFFSRKHAVGVILVPKIEKGFLRVAPPAYTGLAAEERPFSFAATASALVGSELRARLRSNRPLREGVAEITGTDDKVTRVPLALVSTNEVAGAFVLSASSRVRFRVTDVAGLPSEFTAESLLTATHDLPPTVRLVSPAKDGFVADDYQLPFRAEASDDYGIATLRLHRAVNGTFTDPKTFQIEGIRRDGGASEVLELSKMGLEPGDKLSFFAEAIDNCPEPHLARSQTVTLQVVGAEEYNQFLREERDVADLAAKYDEVLAKFRELREEQVQLAEAAAELAKKAAAGDTNALRPDALDRLMARQNELDQRLAQTAKAMDQLVRPQPLYDFEKDLQKQIADETARIRSSTATNSAAMDRIAESTSRSDGKRAVRPADVARLEKETREQAERLGAQEKELEKEVAQPLEDLSRLHDLVNDFNAFKALLDAQQSIAEQTAAYGNKPGPAGREDQLALKELASREKAVREALDELPGMLRDHAKAAGEKFPKAAESGKSLADAIEKQRFSATAGNATDRMLDGDGGRAAPLAKRLGDDMAKLFSECKGNTPGEPGNELDQYLKLSMGGSRKQSLAQMQQCRKFGFSQGFLPKKGNGRGQGSGSGTSQSTGPELSVLGNEPLAQRGPKESSSKPGAGSASGSPANGSGIAAAGEKGDVLRGLNAADRRSDAVSGESSIEAYRPVVDEYFKAITRRP